MAAITWRGVNVAGAEGGKKQSGDAYPGKVNTDYTWPKASSLQPWIDKKASIVRYPIAWERCQPDLNGELTDEAKNALNAAADLVTASGAQFNVDIHNYAERTQRDGIKSKINVDGPVTIAHYANFVGKLATHFKDNELVSIGLMNEPHGLAWSDGSSDAVGLARMYQAGIDAARETGFTGWLTVCPADWGKVAQLDEGDEMGEELAKLTDPLDKLVFEVHQYPDNGEQGDDASIQDNNPNIYEEKLAKGTAWAERHGKKMFLGEFGTPDTELGVEVQTNLIAYLEENAEFWWGYTAWSAGPWWPDSYYYFLEPVDGQDPGTVAPLQLGKDFPGGGEPGPEPEPEPEPDGDLEERVEDLEDSVQDLDNRLTTLQADVDDLKTRVAALEAGGGGSTGGGGDSSLEPRVATLEETVAAIDARLDKIAEGAAG